MIALTPKPTGAISLNYGHPYAEGLYTGYFFNEGGGLRAEDVIGRNDGTFTGGTKFVQTPYGTGLIFDGSGDYITGRQSGNTWSQITVIARCKYSALAVSSRLVCDAAVTSFALGADLTTSSAIRMQIKTGVTTNALAGSGTIVVDEWATFAGLYDGTTVSVIKNGLVLATGSVSGNLNAGAALNVGGGSGLTSINGVVDYVLVYNKALTVAQVAAISCNPYAMLTSPRKIRWNTTAAPPAPSLRSLLLLGAGI